MIVSVESEISQSRVIYLFLEGKGGQSFIILTCTLMLWFWQPAVIMNIGSN